MRPLGTTPPPQNTSFADDIGTVGASFLWLCATLFLAFFIAPLHPVFVVITAVVAVFTAIMFFCAICEIVLLLPKAIKALPTLLRHLATLVYEPVRSWRSVCERQTRGEIGPIKANYELFGIVLRVVVVGYFILCLVPVVLLFLLYFVRLAVRLVS
jgi:hypothetical protein